MSQLKVMTILGTRPEIIRLSRVISLLDERVDHKLVHTGQNWDRALSGVFFEELGIRQPDYILEAGGGSLGETIAKILVGCEKVIKEERPDAILILGDTNSSLSAIIATRLKVPVYHMEAGNRSFDRNVPEEINRKLVDHISDFNLVYTEHARRNLISEGLPHRRIFLTGSPMREVINYYLSKVNDSTAVERLGLAPRGYFLVSLHREENVDNTTRLLSLVGVLNTLAADYSKRIIVSTHPRTKNRMRALEAVEVDPLVQYMDPFGFIDYCALQKSAYCVISDSGTIAEESAILDFPAVSPRDAIERPEALDAGGIISTGLDIETIREAVSAVSQQYSKRISEGRTRSIPAEYEVPNTSERVLNLIIGTARISNAWDGIRKNDLT